MKVLFVIAASVTLIQVGGPAPSQSQSQWGQGRGEGLNITGFLTLKRQYRGALTRLWAVVAAVGVEDEDLEASSNGG